MGLINLLLPFWAAFIIVRYLGELPDRYKKSTGLLHINISIGLGLGMASLTYFVSLLILNNKNFFSTLIELFFYVVIILSSYLLILKNNKKNNYNFSGPTNSKSENNALIQAAFGIALILSIICFLLISINHKHGNWDAWAIWNMRARFLFRSGEAWTKALSNIYALPHTDYPLLLPLNISKVWGCLGSDPVIIPIGIAFLFTFLTIGLIVFALGYLHSLNHGLLAGIVLMGFTRFIKRGATQCADIPFGFYLLATIVFFYLYDTSSKKNKGFLVLAGGMAGLSAWTKNEGMLLILTVMLTHLAITVFAEGWKSYVTQWAAFMVGLFPILILIAYFKMQLVPPNDLIAGQSAHSTLDRLLDSNRYMTITSAFAEKMFELAKIRLTIFPILLFSLGLLRPNRFKKCNGLSAGIITLMLCGYFFVYLTTPHDLNWHLRTSLERLFLQLLPSSIFIFFLNLKPFENKLKL